LIHDRNDRIAAAFNDLRRSAAIERLAAMIDLGAATDADLAQFSPETRAASTALIEIWRGGATRRRRST
jgi:hypothetical protein